RRVGHLLSDERSRQAVAAAEQFADDHTTRKQLATAAAEATAAACPDSKPRMEALFSLAPPTAATAAWWAGTWAAAAAADLAVDNVGSAAHAAATGVAPLSGRADGEEVRGAARAWRDERVAQADLLRDIFGPLPFRALTLAPPLRAWK